MPIPPPQKVDVQIHKFLKLDSEAYIVSQKPLEAMSKCLDFKSFPGMGMMMSKIYPHSTYIYITALLHALICYYTIVQQIAEVFQQWNCCSKPQYDYNYLIIPPFLKSCQTLWATHTETWS